MTTRGAVVAFGAPDVPPPCTVNPDLNGFSAIPKTQLESSCGTRWANFSRVSMQFLPPLLYTFKRPSKNLHSRAKVLLSAPQQKLQLAMQLCHPDDHASAPTGAGGFSILEHFHSIPKLTPSEMVHRVVVEWISGTFFRQFALMLSALVSNDFPPFGAAAQSLVFMINFGVPMSAGLVTIVSGGHQQIRTNHVCI